MLFYFLVGYFLSSEKRFDKIAIDTIKIAPIPIGKKIKDHEASVIIAKTAVAPPGGCKVSVNAMANIAKVTARVIIHQELPKAW